MALYGLLALRADLSMTPNAASGLVTAAAIIIPTAVLAAGTTDDERRTVTRVLVLLALVQVVVALAEFTFLPAAPWAAEARVGAFGAIEGPLRQPNELLGGTTLRAQGTMGHPLPLGALLVVGFAVLARNPMEWPVLWVRLSAAALGLGVLLNGSRSVVLLAGALMLLAAGRNA